MRTEANKMHKSIPLRKQETHSASLMTDLGLNSFLCPGQSRDSPEYCMKILTRICPSGL